LKRIEDDHHTQLNHLSKKAEHAILYFKEIAIQNGDKENVPAEFNSEKGLTTYLADVIPGITRSR